MSSVGDLAFEALADPTRRAILCFLAAEGECSAGKIAAVTGALGRSSVSSHLRVLRAAGLVKQRKQGRFRLYSLDPNPTRDVIDFLARYTAPPGVARSTPEPASDNGTRPSGWIPKAPEGLAENS